MGIEEELRSALEGDVRFDTISRQVYSVDASIYEIEPLGVVYPKSEHDIISILQIAQNHQIPVIPRGAATGITGGCIGKGLIIDVSKYLNKILEINIEQEYVICQPGVVQDDLNAALFPHGYRLGPDTSTGDRATLGGMLANNAAGARSLRYGKMVDHVLAVDLLLANSEKITLSTFSESEFKLLSEQSNTLGKIIAALSKIKTTSSDEIAIRFPNIPRRVSGYNLDELIKPWPLNAAKLIAGSEGTLGIASSIKMRISPLPKKTGICLLHFENMLEGLKHIEAYLEFDPLSVEMIDHFILDAGKHSPLLKNRLQWLQDNPQAIIAVELEAEDIDQLNHKLQQFQTVAKANNWGYAQPTLTATQDINDLWSIRKAGLGLLLSKRSFSRAIAFIEDLTIPPQQLSSFMQEFLDYLLLKGKQAGIYGHVGSGCMHIRPYIDLRNPEELQLMHKIMDDICAMVLKHGGSMSGEHGDGLVRSWLNPKLFGEKIYQAFIQLKHAFDPFNRMNPGKIVNGQELTENLRISPATEQKHMNTFLDFSAEGGFNLAVDMCNGNGLCRKKNGTMCPSFQATNDEYDTTRARAQTLRSIINGKIPLTEFTGEGLQDVLDLCLECKGCKKECPSQVDMAKMKAEVLYHYQEKHGYSLRSRLFAHIDTLNHLGSYLPYLFNAGSSSNLFKMGFGALGISTKRSIPQLAKHTFSSLFRNLSPFQSDKKVVLFVDTYTECNVPELGMDAVKVLNKLGFEVIIPPWSCCGRPAFSKGFLQLAKKKAEKVVQQLTPYVEKGLPILGLEPSCILTLKDEFPALLRSQEAINLSKCCLTIDEFLHQQIHHHESDFNFRTVSEPLYLHGHCHQKALIGVAPTMELLNTFSEEPTHLIDSGCCGMAGSFGYEAEHYDISMKIAELKLFPAIRQAPNDAIIVANGISCRTQIHDGLGVKALHTIQVLAQALNLERIKAKG